MPEPYDRYIVSREGIVASFNGAVRAYVNNAGYLIVNVSLSNGKHTSVPVHRLLALAFVDNKHNYPVVDHANDDRLDNSIGNLHWVSYHYNLTKRHRMSQMAGSQAKNKGVHVIKVTDEGEHVVYSSLSAAASANGISAVSVSGNAHGELHLNRPYHFIFA